MRVIIATNQILELLELARQGRAQQANISQKTEIESQDRKDNKSKESQNNQTVKVIEAEDTGDLLAEIAQLQSQNKHRGGPFKLWGSSGSQVHNYRGPCTRILDMATFSILRRETRRPGIAPVLQET